MKLTASMRRRLKLLVFAGTSLLIVGCVSGGGSFWFFSQNLPSVNQIRADEFPTVTEVYDQNGEVIGEFYSERRYLLSYDEIPQQMVDAITSAEDDNFFEHSGIDYTGIVRAALRNASEGEVVQGASTITMQLAKSLLLTPERKMKRKIKEAILARRIEKNFSKQAILALYLNHVFFGRAAYGVEAASREYFGKHIDELSVAQMALIAGLPKAPSEFSKPANFGRWKERQEWILDRMAKLEKITPEEAEAAKAEVIILQPRHDPNTEIAPYFVEHIRKELVKAYGDDAVLKGGLRVHTTADAGMCRSGQGAVRTGLRALDKRQGWRGPIRNVAKRDEWPAALTELDGKRGLVAGKALAPGERIHALVVAVDVAKGKASIAWGVDYEKNAELRGTLLLRDASWAREPDPEILWEEDLITNIGKAVKPGDVVWIEPKVISEAEALEKVYEPGPKYVTLEQEPIAQGALLAMDPKSGAVRAMIGGYDFQVSEYNRAHQMKRQPGSAFKPVVYAAAIDSGIYNPSTILMDSPIVYADAVPDPTIEEARAGEDEAITDDAVWKPKNFGAKYYGDTTFRTALVLSRNVVTIKILQDIGVDYVAEYSKNLGMEKDPQRDLSLALGTTELSPTEMARVYSVFANGGKMPDPFFIRRVEDRDGRVLEWHAEAEDAKDPFDLVASLGVAAASKPSMKTHFNRKYPPGGAPRSLDATEEAILRGDNLAPGYVIDPGTAYLLTDLMKDVVRFGTATGANIGRPAAGKTGTTNDEGDAWFVGFTPDLVASVWVGFDDPKKPLGKNETGGHSAVPIWTKFMVDATKGKPARDFPQPSGIVRLQVDREKGLRACPDTENPVYVAFKEGTEPQAFACQSGTGVPGGLPQDGLSPTNNVPSGLPPE